MWISIPYGLGVMMSPLKATHRPHRPIRIEEELWKPFGELAGVRDRAEVIRQFVAWYIRKPGAKLPQRPAARRADPADPSE